MLWFLKITNNNILKNCQIIITYLMSRCKVERYTVCVIDNN